MARSNLGAVRLPFLAAAVLASLSVSLSAQVVERGRTFADLTASHPCASGLTDRIARVTDCDAADDIGDGGGAFQCWAICDGSAPWAAVSIGGGAGAFGPATALASPVVIEGTADAFEGNFTFADPTADWTWAWGADGSLTGPDGVVVISPVNGTSFYAGSPDGFTTLSVSSSSIDLSASVDGTVETASVFTVNTSGVNVDLQDGLQQYEVTAAAGFNFAGTRFRINVPAPTNANDACFAGMIAWDSSHFYVCIATDTWVRVAMATWP